MSSSPSGRRQIVVEHTTEAPNNRKNRVSGLLSTVGNVLRRSRLTELDELRQERRRLLAKVGRLIVDVGCLPGLCPDLSRELSHGGQVSVAGSDIDWGLLRRVNELSDRVRHLDAQIAALKHEQEEISEEIALPSEYTASEERAHQALDGVGTEDLREAYRSAVKEA